MSQTRYSFTQSFTLGTGWNAWQYKIILWRVVNPTLVWDGLTHDTPVPSYIEIQSEALKAGFDIAVLTGADKVPGISFKLLDDPGGSWLQTNVFTAVASNTVYQIQVQCDKGSGTFGTIFF